MKFLYRDFLNSKKVYNLNEAFYKQLVKSVTGSEPAPFFNTTLGNGKKICDDHLFNTKLDGRIIQIIQRETASLQPPVKIHFRKWEGETDMLVLSVQLSSEIKSVLKAIVEAWFVKKNTPEVIEQLLTSLTTHFDSESPYPIGGKVEKRVVAEEGVEYRKSKK